MDNLNITKPEEAPNGGAQEALNVAVGAILNLATTSVSAEMIEIHTNSIARSLQTLKDYLNAVYERTGIRYLDINAMLTLNQILEDTNSLRDHVNLPPVSVVIGFSEAAQQLK